MSAQSPATLPTRDAYSEAASPRRRSRGSTILTVAGLVFVVLLIVSLLTVVLLGRPQIGGPPAAVYPPGTVLVVTAGWSHTLGPGEGSGGGPYNVSMPSTLSGSFVATGGGGIDLYLLNASDWNWSSQWSPVSFSPFHAVWSTLDASAASFTIPVAPGTYYAYFNGAGPASCDLKWTSGLGFFPKA